ncbi:MAG: leucine-rich repeat protein [Clostridia bacterium]|nr:leucine-rich repeat protein [Clostridia bacterium]
MKKIISLFLALVIVAGVLTVAPVNVAATDTEYLTFEKVTSGGGYQETVGYSVADCKPTATGEIIIPETYNGLPVTQIKGYAFEGCNNITSVVIPDSVTSTGYRVFNKCKNLVSVDLGNGITTLSASIFYDCCSLKNVILPAGLRVIGQTAFRNCTSLNEIKLPKGITRIEENAFNNTGFYNDSLNWENEVLYYGEYLIKANQLTGAYTIKDGTKVIAEYAFSGCPNLVLINIPDSVEHIGYRAFRGTGYYSNQSNWKNGALYIGKFLIRLNIEFEGSCSIKDGTTLVADQAFYNCEFMTSVRIPASVKRIGTGAFTLSDVSKVYISDLNAWFNIEGGTPTGGSLYLNDALVEDVVVPDGVTSINSGRLSFSHIKTIKLPDSVETIGNYAFSNCKSLTSINIPDGVTYIGNNAFYNCSKLSSLSIPEGVTYIGNSAFRYCSGINSLEIPQGISAIGNWTFAECSNLTSIKLPDGLTEIGEGAFLGCTSVSEIYVPASLKKWGYRSFEKCQSIKEVNITDLKAWCESTFIYNTSNPLNNGAKLYLNGSEIKDLVVPDTATKINSYVFYKCSSFESVKIGKNVKSIGDYSFLGCTNIVTIEIPEEVSSIGRQAFENCEKLESVYLSENVESIGEAAFRGCLNLMAYTVAEDNNTYSSVDGVLFNADKSLLIDYPINKSGSTYTMPDSVTEIGEDAFKGCTGLTSVKLSNNLKIIDSYAFYGCSKLATIDIPDGVTDINSYAFAYCTSLTSIQIPDSVTKLESGALVYCEALAEIFIPDSVTKIGSGLISGTAYYNNEANWDGEGLYIGSHLIRVKALTGPFEVKAGTKAIADSAFYDCYGLTILILPQTIRTIGTSALSSCTKLSEVFIPDLTTWCNIDFRSAMLSCSANLYVGNSLVTDVVIPKSVTKINNYAFYQININSVKLHDNVESIGKSAFKKCLNLSTVELGNGVKNVGDEAFYHCENLKSVRIGENVTEIGTRAFGYYSTYYGLEHSRISNFKIIGDKNTEAQNYADANSFKFEIECKHNNTEWVVSQEATVYRAGHKYQRCSYCYKYFKSETIPQLKCDNIVLKKVYNTTDGVKITWRRVKGADAYRVYRKVKGGSFEYLDSTKNSYFTDKTAKSGTTYYYTVKAKNEAGLSGYNKTGLSVKYVETPKLKKIANATGGLKITWSKVSGADGYYVYRKLYGADAWTRVATIKNGSTVSYKDTKVSKGKVYVYTVKAYDGTGKSSISSDGIYLRYLAVPALKSVTSTTKGVKLTWGKVTGAEGYYVYRKTGSGDWKKIGTVNDSTTLYYTDKTAKKGTTYKYTVRAFKGTTNSYYNTKGLTIKDKY